MPEAKRERARTGVKQQAVVSNNWASGHRTKTQQHTTTIQAFIQ